MSQTGSSVVVYETDHGEVKLSPTMIRQYLVSGDARAVSDQEIVMFLQLCKFQKLNPWLREAYLIKYGNSPATMITGKDVFTKRASKHPDFNGMEAGIYVQTIDGQLSERKGTLALPGEKVVGGWAKVHRKGWEYPVTSAVSMDEYMGRKRDGTPSGQWVKMPATMIAKVAKVQALREAFPEDFQGLYDQSEIPTEQDLSDRPVAPPAPEAPEAPAEQKPVAEDAQIVEDENPEEPPDPLAALRLEAKKLCWTALENKIFTQAQHDAFVAQLQNLKSENAMQAMVANFQRQLGRHEEERF